MTYEAYLRSAEWRRKRAARLEFDGHCCRLCDAVADLEVHHRPDSYRRIPNESVEYDLITLCRACHELITNRIRARRYARERAPLLTSLDSESLFRPGASVLIFPALTTIPQPQVERFDYGMEIPAVETHRLPATHHA